MKEVTILFVAVIAFLTFAHARGGPRPGCHVEGK